jgi:hypothetical protein
LPIGFRWDRFIICGSMLFTKVFDRWITLNMKHITTTNKDQANVSALRLATMAAATAAAAAADPAATPVAPPAVPVVCSLRRRYLANDGKLAWKQQSGHFKSLLKRGFEQLLTSSSTGFKQNRTTYGSRH